MSAKLSFELGMPHLGRNNLSESALFKVIGNHRWEQIQKAGDIHTAQIRDDAGSRLYATFFFLEVNSSPEIPLSSFGENETLAFDSDFSHYGRVYLDGRHTLARDKGFWIRSSNVFIYQERGPSKLSLSVPANMNFSNIPELEVQPDSLDLCRRARSRGVFFDSEPDDVELLDGGREFIYQIDADRDLNGAGLVYFANFISFLDLAERSILGALPTVMPASLLDARSTYRRQMGYYGNAQSTDCLQVQVRARMRTLQGKQNPLLDLGLDHRIRRSSDGKEIVISSCRKVASLQPGSEGEKWVSKWTGKQ